MRLFCQGGRLLLLGFSSRAFRDGDELVVARGILVYLPLWGILLSEMCRRVYYRGVVERCWWVTIFFLAVGGCTKCEMYQYE